MYRTNSNNKMALKSLPIATIIIWTLKMVVVSATTTEKSDTKLEILSLSSLPYVPIGLGVILHCVLFENNRSLDGVDVEWIRPNGQLAEEVHQLFVQDVYKSSFSLIIRSLKSDTGGNYTCRANYNNNNLSATVEIKAIYGIKFSNDCGSRQFIVADHSGSKTIRCGVFMNLPEPLRIDDDYDYDDNALPFDSSTDTPVTHNVQIQWLKNGNPYDPPSGRCHVNNSIGIGCDEVIEADAGNYTITARMTSPVNQTLNRTIVVEVRTLPHIQNLSTEVVAVENSTVKLTCAATGNPPPTYAWSSNARHTFWSTLRRFRYDKISGTLIIHDVSRHDAGLISCLAENSVGGDIRKVKLVVTTTEGAPFEEDWETMISPQNDLMFDDNPKLNDDASQTSNSTRIHVKELFGFVLVFLCLLMLFVVFDVGCYVTRRRGVIALLYFK